MLFLMSLGIGLLCGIVACLMVVVLAQGLSSPAGFALFHEPASSTKTTAQVWDLEDASQA